MTWPTWRCCPRRRLRAGAASSCAPGRPVPPVFRRERVTHASLELHPAPRACQAWLVLWPCASTGHEQEASRTRLLQLPNVVAPERCAGRQRCAREPGSAGKRANPDAEQRPLTAACRAGRTARGCRSRACAAGPRARRTARGGRPPAAWASSRAGALGRAAARRDDDQQVAEMLRVRRRVSGWCVRVQR
jgi:hypothetical protein